MQFSLRAIMLLILVVALVLVVPPSVTGGLAGAVVFVVPALLVTAIRCGRGPQQTFGWGALATYAAIVLCPGSRWQLSGWFGVTLTLVTVTLAGWLSVRLEQWLRPPQLELRTASTETNSRGPNSNREAEH